MSLSICGIFVEKICILLNRKTTRKTRMVFLAFLNFFLVFFIMSHNLVYMAFRFATFFALPYSVRHFFFCSNSKPFSDSVFATFPGTRVLCKKNYLLLKRIMIVAAVFVSFHFRNDFFFVLLLGWNLLLF